MVIEVETSHKIPERLLGTHSFISLNIFSHALGLHLKTRDQRKGMKCVLVVLQTEHARTAFRGDGIIGGSGRWGRKFAGYIEVNKANGRQSGCFFRRERE